MGKVGPGTRPYQEAIGRACSSGADHLVICGSSLRGEPQLVEVPGVHAGARSGHGGRGSRSCSTGGRRYPRALSVARPGDLVLIFGSWRSPAHDVLLARGPNGFERGQPGDRRPGRRARPDCRPRPEPRRALRDRRRQRAWGGGGDSARSGAGSNLADRAASGQRGPAEGALRDRIRRACDRGGGRKGGRHRAAAPGSGSLGAEIWTPSTPCDRRARAPTWSGTGPWRCASARSTRCAPPARSPAGSACSRSTPRAGTPTSCAARRACGRRSSWSSTGGTSPTRSGSALRARGAPLARRGPRPAAVPLRPSRSAARQRRSVGHRRPGRWGVGQSRLRGRFPGRGSRGGAARPRPRTTRARRARHDGTGARGRGAPRVDRRPTDEADERLELIERLVQAAEDRGRLVERLSATVRRPPSSSSAD